MFSSSQLEGGGFMSSQPSQITDSTSFSDRDRESQKLMPVTVKQISEAYQSGREKSNFIIDGVTNVTMVGMVYDKAERVTDVGFILDDGTGHIECKRWANERFDTKEMEEIHDGMYVRLIGNIKSFQGTRHLVAFSVRPVVNFDEVAFHFINCIHFHLQKSGSRVQSDSASQPQIVDSSFNTPIRNGVNVKEEPSSNQFSEELSVDGVSGRDLMVLNYFRQPLNYERVQGVHVDELSLQLKLPKEKIMESISYLEDEGLIYSTIDQFHFKAAGSD